MKTNENIFWLELHSVRSSFTQEWDENIFKKKIIEYSKKKKKNSEKVQYMGNSGKVEFQGAILK